MGCRAGRKGSVNIYVLSLVALSILNQSNQARAIIVIIIIVIVIVCGINGRTRADPTAPCKWWPCRVINPLTSFSSFSPSHFGDDAVMKHDSDIRAACTNGAISEKAQQVAREAINPAAWVAAREPCYGACNNCASRNNNVQNARRCCCRNIIEAKHLPRHNSYICLSQLKIVKRQACARKWLMRYHRW